jgi:hypothetical protein
MATVAQIDTAILAILTEGQSVMIDGVQFSRANLKTLYTMRRDSKREAALSNGTRRRRKTLNLSQTGY